MADNYRSTSTGTFYSVMKDTTYLGRPCQETVSPRFATRKEARDWAELHEPAMGTLHICETTLYPEDDEAGTDQRGALQ